MLDASNGAVVFEQPSVTIRPSLTRDDFLLSPLAAGARTHVQNEPYHSWKLAGEYFSSGHRLLVVLWFHHQRITALSLTDVDPYLGTSWADYSLEKEMTRKSRHDSWLEKSLGAQRKFPWGKVWSGYDERGGFSSIEIAYAEGG